jgi:hypothetical protein
MRGSRRPAAGRTCPGVDEAACGPDHPRVAIRLSNLAILKDLGERAGPPGGRTRPGYKAHGETGAEQQNSAVLAVSFLRYVDLQARLHRKAGCAAVTVRSADRRSRAGVAA